MSDLPEFFKAIANEREEKQRYRYFRHEVFKEPPLDLVSHFKCSIAEANMAVQTVYQKGTYAGWNISPTAEMNCAIVLEILERRHNNPPSQEKQFDLFSITQTSCQLPRANEDGDICLTLPLGFRQLKTLENKTIQQKKDLSFMIDRSDELKNCFGGPEKFEENLKFELRRRFEHTDSYIKNIQAHNRSFQGKKPITDRRTPNGGLYQ